MDDSHFITASPPLTYAPRGRWRWRLPRRYIVGGVVAALAIAGWRWGGDAVRLAQNAYWVRQCMRYAPPADLVVFEQDEGEIARLKSTNPAYRVSKPGEANPPFAWLSPAEYAYIPQSGWAPQVAFMHGRRSDGGPQRLVVIECLVLRVPETPDHTVFLHPRVFAASMLQAGKQVRRNEDTVRIHLAPDERLRLYAGKPDAGDASRFTIECVVAGERGTIEGRLNPGDLVTFRPIAGDELKRRWRTWDRSTTRPWWDFGSHGDAIPASRSVIRTTPSAREVPSPAADHESGKSAFSTQFVKHTRAVRPLFPGWRGRDRAPTRIWAK